MKVVKILITLIIIIILIGCNGKAEDIKNNVNEKNSSKEIENNESEIVLTNEIKNGSENWHIEKVDENEYAGLFNSMAVDDNDKIHISYYDGNTGQLRYATNKSGVWKLYTIEKRFGKYNSIAIDNAENVYIAYFNDANEELKIARIKDDNVNKEVIDKIDSISVTVPIVIDKENFIHVVYSNIVLDYLKYGTNKNGKWGIKIIDKIEYQISNTDISLDNNDNVHIAYMVTGDIYYINNKNKEWQKIKLADDSKSDMVLSYPRVCIEVDSKGFVHIVYTTTSALKYITNKDGQWKRYVILEGLVEGEEENEIYSETSLALDSKDNLHIAFKVVEAEGWQKMLYGEIRFLTNKSGNWEMSVVEKTGDLVSMKYFENVPSIVIDKNDYVHMCYNVLDKDEEGEFHYATNRQ